MFPAGANLFNVNNVNTRTMCEIFSELTVKTRDWRHGCHSGVFTVNFGWIPYIFLVFGLLTLSK